MNLTRLFSFFFSVLYLLLLKGELLLLLLSRDLVGVLVLLLFIIIGVSTCYTNKPLCSSKWTVLPFILNRGSDSSSFASSPLV